MRVVTAWARRMAVSTAAAGLALALAPGALGQGAAGGQWPTYGGDLGSTRYAALAQIDKTLDEASSTSRTWARPASTRSRARPSSSTV